MVIDTTICIEALTAWPVEARPKHVDRSHGRFFCTTLCESDMEDHHAIDLFIASGLRWLADNSNQHISVAHGYQTSNQWCVWYNDGDVNLGPTLLAAIDTAIRTTRPRSTTAITTAAGSIAARRMYPRPTTAAAATAAIPTTTAHRLTTADRHRRTTRAHRRRSIAADRLTAAHRAAGTSEKEHTIQQEDWKWNPCQSHD